MSCGSSLFKQKMFADDFEYFDNQYVEIADYLFIDKKIDFIYNIASWDVNKMNLINFLENNVKYKTTFYELGDGIAITEKRG